MEDDKKCMKSLISFTWLAVIAISYTYTMTCLVILKQIGCNVMDILFCISITPRRTIATLMISTKFVFGTN